MFLQQHMTYDRQSTTKIRRLSAQERVRKLRPQESAAATMIAAALKELCRREHERDDSAQ